MGTFKVIFAKNRVISCEATDKTRLAKEYYYEHDKGQLIFALINAENEADAISKSDKIVNEVIDKVFGNDFVE